MPKRGKKKVKVTKDMCIRFHANKRFFQHYGVTLTNTLHDEIVKKIQIGDARIVEKQSLRVSLFELSIKRIKDKIIVVYDKRRHQIVTVLPPADSPLNYNNH